MTNKHARPLALTGAVAALTLATALLGAGAANAAASYTKHIDTYPTYSICVDVGQSYVREGFRSYDCLATTGGYMLWLNY